jgi:hypothetical protein
VIWINDFSIGNFVSSGFSWFTVSLSRLETYDSGTCDAGPSFAVPRFRATKRSLVCVLALRMSGRGNDQGQVNCRSDLTRTRPKTYLLVLDPKFLVIVEIPLGCPCHGRGTDGLV